MSLKRIKENLEGQEWTNVHGKKCQITKVVEKNLPGQGPTVFISVQKGKRHEVHDNRSRPRPVRVG